MKGTPLRAADEASVPSARTAAPDADRATPAAGRSSGRFLARAALLTAVLSVAGSVLGLARDQALARLFGAGGETDAFLVAWTVPEFAATLLIEDGLAFALVPMFSLALARRAQGAPGDPVRALVASTLPGWRRPSSRSARWSSSARPSWSGRWLRGCPSTPSPWTAPASPPPAS